MAAPAAPPTQGARETRRFIRLMLVALAALFVTAILLWARYGTVVFLETMANAWAYCF